MASVMLTPLEQTLSIHSNCQNIHLLFDGAPDGLCLLGPGPTVLAANPAAIEMLDLPAEPKESDPVSGEITHGLRSLADEVFGRGRPVHREYTAKDGRVLLVTAQPAPSFGGTVSFVILALRDLASLGAGVATMRLRGERDGDPARSPSEPESAMRPWSWSPGARPWPRLGRRRCSTRWWTRPS